jgi:hypothetical protein
LLVIIFSKKINLKILMWRISMVTEISLNTICGHTTKVIAKKEGKKTHVHIKTSCEKIRKWGNEFDMEMKDLMGGPDSILAIKSAESPLTPTCYVPATVMNACWLENGMISKNLAKSMGKIEVIFDKLEDEDSQK